MKQSYYVTANVPIGIYVDADDCADAVRQADDTIREALEIYDGSILGGINGITVEPNVNEDEDER